jgi:hypothetical protein
MVTVTVVDARDEKKRVVAFESTRPVCFEGQRHRRFTVVGDVPQRQNRRVSVTGVIANSLTSFYAFPVYLDINSWT